MWSYLVFVGAVVQLWGIYAYIKETLRGNVKPNRVTWLLWSLAPLIATGAAVSDGAGLSALPVFMSGFGPFLVLLATFRNKNAYWELKRLDYLCGFFSVVALVLWLITKQPVAAILFAILSDTLAAIPTLRKAWRHPETEDATAFTTGVFSAATSFSAIKIWSFPQWAFPAYLVCMNGLIAIGALRKKRSH